MHAINAKMRTIFSALYAVSAAGLVAGCSDGSLSSMLAGPNVAKTATIGQATPETGWTTVALTPFHGPPPEFSQALIRELNRSATERKIAILVDPNAVGDYVLRGNFIASNSNNKLVLAYNWDVLDKAGNRINRASEEISADAPSAGANAWVGVSPATIKAVAERAVAALTAQVTPSQ